MHSISLTATTGAPPAHTLTIADLALPDLTDDAKRHTAFIDVLARLADLGGETPDGRERGDRVVLRPGAAVSIERNKVWRVGLVARVTTSPRTQVGVAWLSPAALDKAQRTWTRDSVAVLDEEAPLRAARRALAEHPHNATTAWHAAHLAYRDAVLRRAVALHCERRRWAAVVPVNTTDVWTDEVHRFPDQSLTAAPIA